MAFTRLQTVGNATSTATFGAVTPGTLLVCLVVGHDAGSGYTCSDSVNGAWTAVGTLANPYGASSKDQAWFYFIGTAAGSPVVTVAGDTGASRWIQIAEYSATGPIIYDTPSHALGSVTTATTFAITSGTPTSAGLLLMGTGANLETMTYSAGAGYTLVGVGGAAGGAQVLAMGENIGATVATAMNLNCTNSTEHNGEIIGFRQAAQFTSGTVAFSVEDQKGNNATTNNSVDLVITNQQRGDLLIASVTNGGDQTFTAPSGWTVVYNAGGPEVGSGSATFSKELSVSESSPVTISWPTAQSYNAVLIKVRSSDPGAECIAVDSVNGIQTVDNSASYTVPSNTIAAGNYYVYGINSEGGAAAITYSQAHGDTELIDVNYAGGTPEQLAVYIGVGLSGAITRTITPSTANQVAATMWGVEVQEIPGIENRPTIFGTVL